MSRSRPVEQALHGYRNGHRLLAASVDLSGPDKRFLSVVTDSADAGKSRGWDALLAGYPLPSKKWFGLSMTWPASGGSRAGAVWTHTLFLDRESVALADRIDFCTAFVRPQSLDEITFFSKPLAVKVSDNALRTGYNEWVAEVNWVLHQLPIRPVEIVTTEPPAKRHDLLVSLWTELWPELRAVWSFAEAPSTRKSGFGKPLDLQVMHGPQGAADEEVRVVKGTLSRRPPEWAQVLADLRRGDDASVHDFLDHYGPHAPNAREAVAALVEIWLAIERSRPNIRAVETVERIARSFGAPGQMEALKGDLLQARKLHGTSHTIPAADAVAAILQVGGDGFASPAVTRIALDAIGGMAGEPLGRTLAAAVEKPSSTLGRAILDSAVEAFSDGAPPWTREQQDIIVRLVGARPEIAANPEVWTIAEPSPLWSAVRHARAQKLRRPIVHAMVRAGAAVPEREVAEAWSNVFDTVLAAVAEDDLDPDAAARWLAAGAPEHVAEWARSLLDSDPKRFNKLAGLLPPEVISSLPAAHLHALACRPEASPTTLMSVFLAAIRDHAKSSAEVAVICYDRLYPLAITENLGAARSQLDNVDVDVPSWEPALRLARLLNRGFKEHPWPTAPIFRLRREPFEALISADSKAGLARRLVAAESEPNAWQGRALADIIAERMDRDGVRQLVLSVLSRVNPF